MKKKLRMLAEAMMGAGIGFVGVYQIVCAVYHIEPAVLAGVLCVAASIGLILLSFTEENKDMQY